MQIDKFINDAMGMDDDKWLRHANPLSVWTRLATVPVFGLIVYVRPWLGWWCLVLIGLIFLFLWLNTRIFPCAKTDERWETRAILGERLWLDRRKRPIPAHHQRATFRIAVGSSLCILPLIIGLVWFEPWATALGVAGMLFGQIWLLDRFAWLYESTKIQGDRQPLASSERDPGPYRAR